MDGKGVAIANGQSGSALRDESLALEFVDAAGDGFAGCAETLSNFSMGEGAVDELTVRTPFEQ